MVKQQQPSESLTTKNSNQIDLYRIEHSDEFVFFIFLMIIQMLREE